MTAALASRPDLVIAPSRTWTTVADRLVAEMTISTGTVWLQRHEALNRLLTHPRGRLAAIDSLAASARDRDNQIFIETVCALEGSHHPDAGRHVVGQVREPTNNRAQHGGLLAAVRKLMVGHFTPDQVTALVDPVADLVADASTDNHTLAVQLAARMPVEVLRPRCRDAPGQGTPDPNTALRRRTVADRVADAAAARSSGSAGRDQFLPVLVEDLLFHSNPDVRLYTGFLLAATPYRSSLGAALAAELSGGRARYDPDLSQAVLNALRQLGGPDQRTLVQRLTIADGIPAEVRLAAARAAAHIPGGGPSAALVGHAIRLSKVGRAPILDTVVYGLGINGDDDQLLRLAGNWATPAPARRAARWWLARPHYIRDSATQ
jgi:hypothetical protein